MLLQSKVVICYIVHRIFEEGGGVSNENLMLR